MIHALLVFLAGQSEYNKLKLIGGDSNISDDGEKYASRLPAVLQSRLPEVINPPCPSCAKASTRHLPFSDAGGRSDAAGVDIDVEAHHPDGEASAVRQAAVEGPR